MRVTGIDANTRARYIGNVRHTVCAVCAVVVILSTAGCGASELQQKQIQDDLTEAGKYAEIWNTGQMRTWIDRAIAVDPKNADTYVLPIDQPTDDVSIHDVCISAGDYATDEIYMTQAVANFPNRMEPLEALMTTQEIVGDHAGEQATATKLVHVLEGQVGKGNISDDKLDTLADAYWKAGNHAKSIATFQRVMTIYPANAQALNDLAYMYADSNDQAHMHQALTLANGAVGKAQQQTTPDADLEVGLYQDTVAWVQYRLGNYAQALDASDQAVGAIPREPELRYHLGMIYLAEGNTSAAEVEFRHAVLLAPAYADASAALARLTNAPTAAPPVAATPPVQPTHA